jgi:hypothetical protein
MTSARCRFCRQTATGTVTSPSLNGPIPHCDACWEQAYDIVHTLIPHTWKLIKTGRKPLRQPDLFDHLEEGSDTA